jgi:HSP20 family molecular chaperone IbpA
MVAENCNQYRKMLSERLVGESHRTFTLPSKISKKGIKANIEDGVLYLVVPKTEGKSKGGRSRLSLMLLLWWICRLSGSKY